MFLSNSATTTQVALASAPPSPVSTALNTSTMKERGGFKELVAGTVSGAAGVVAGNPLDTIRVRIQTLAMANVAPKYTGTIDCAIKTFRFEGTKGFFKGMSSPLASIPFSNAAIFAVYGNALHHFRSSLPSPSSPSPSPSLSHYFPELAAGALAGFVNSFILCPVEHIKIQRQISISTAVSPSLLPSFQGLSATILRDAPGFAVYFASYEYMRTGIFQALPPSQSRREGIAAFVSGGLAGALSWVVSTPFDVIKSNMQAHPRENPTFMQCCRNLYRAGGSAAFFKGLQPSVLRALPTNAVIFLVYESMHNMF